MTNMILEKFCSYSIISFSTGGLVFMIMSVVVMSLEDEYKEEFVPHGHS